MMHRSSASGSNQVSVGDFYKHSASSPSSSTQSFRAVLEADELPIYNPQSDAAKKELGRLRSAQNAVHFIPLIIALCALILWFFSNTDSYARQSIAMPI